MKRFIAVVTVCLMVFSLMLTGCGQSAGTGGTEATVAAADASAAPAAESEAAASTAEASGNTIAAEDMLVGFIYVGPVTDNGWTTAHDNGRKYIEEQIPGVKTMFKESVPEGAEAKKSIMELVDAGCKIIFTTSFGYMDPTEEVAKEHPEVKFMHCSGYKTAENMSNYFGRMYEARYLSGIVAGLKTQNGKVGYVAATQIPEVFNGVNAFALGVQSVRPDATITVRWSNTWYDTAKEKEAAVAVLDEGCDVMTLHNDSTAVQIEAQDRGASVIGYNLDIPDAAPKAYMTAPIWNWGPYYVSQVKAVMDGAWKSESYLGGISDGLLDLAPLTANAPADAKAKVDEVRAKILDGSFKVFTGPISGQDGSLKVKEGETLTEAVIGGEMNWFVKGVEGTTDGK